MRLLKRLGGAVGVLVLVALVGFVGYRWATTAKIYPPTDIQGHTEAYPPQRILTTPMPLDIHKHILEHSQDSGRSGVIINYNCTDFECAPDTIERLEAIARAYGFVYLAPFPGMDAKITVTRLGRQIVLDSVDEARIREFIERG